MAIPIFLMIIVAIAEFSFLFTSYVSVSFASKDAVQVAAMYGNTDGADCALIQRINNDISAPANKQQIKEIDIYWVNISDTHAGAMSGAITVYTYNGLDNICTMPDGTKYHHPFGGPTPNGYPVATRCNVNGGTDCLPTGGVTHATVDTVAVKITYQYTWVTPFPQMVGGSGTGPLLTQLNIMRLEPIR